MGFTEKKVVFGIKSIFDNFSTMQKLLCPVVLVVQLAHNMQLEPMKTVLIIVEILFCPGQFCSLNEVVPAVVFTVQQRRYRENLSQKFSFIYRSCTLFWHCEKV